MVCICICIGTAVQAASDASQSTCWCDQPGPCHGHNLYKVADADIDDGALV